MKYAPIPADLFVRHRRRLAAALKPNSLAVVVANDILPTNADGTMPFHQNASLFYLTGVAQEETILVLYPDAFDRERHRELLFLRRTDEHVAMWEGEKLTREAASTVTGIPESNIHWTDDFENLWPSLMFQAEHVYLHLNEHPRAGLTVETREFRFARSCRKRFPLHRYERLAPLLARMRARKSATEIGLIKEAVEITGAGFCRVARFVKPGIGEWEIEAELAHEFLRRKSQGFAYEPIIASGRNACVLHYTRNDAVCRDGELLLLDVAAEYAHYNADLTRTIPVNGRFTKRQRRVYEAVLRVLRAGINSLRPGIFVRDWQREAGEAMEKELVDLKLLKMKNVRNQDTDRPLYKKYFMHGLGHHLGLDVHDVGPTTDRVAAGMVFTVEPGLYIPEESLAVRIENDIVVGARKNVDLMDGVPMDVEAIEDLMASRDQDSDPAIKLARARTPAKPPTRKPRHSQPHSA